MSAFGFTPGSSHSVVIRTPSGSATTIGTLTASGTGQISATFMIFFRPLLCADIRPGYGF